MWIHVTSVAFDLHEYLLPTENVRKPSFFGWRIFFYILLSLLASCVVATVFLIVPVVVGRILNPLRGELSDLTSFVIGLTVMSAAYHFATQVPPSADTAIRTTLAYMVATLKWMIGGVMGFIVLPFLFGVFFELSFIHPIRCHANETCPISVSMDGFAGVFFLKTWISLLDFYHYLQNRNQNQNQNPDLATWEGKFQKLYQDGYLAVDLGFIWKKMILPLLNPILLMLSIPYLFLSIGVVVIVMFYTFLLRYVYPLQAFLLLVFECTMILIRWFPQFKQTVIDDNYLIGRQLQNFGALAATNNHDNDLSELDEPANDHLPQEVMEEVVL